MLSAGSVGMLVVSAAAFQAARLLVYLVWIAAVAVWMLLMLKTFKGETWRVPFAPDLASQRTRLAAREPYLVAGAFGASSFSTVVILTVPLACEN